MELVISVVIAILIVEVYAWLPKISEWLVELAVQRLRSEDQDRCREEWKAGLNELPNSFFKFVHALSNFGAADRINADFFEGRLHEINALIEECGHKHSRKAARIHAAIEEIGRSQQELGSRLSDLKADVVEEPDKAWQSAVRLLDACCSGVSRIATIDVDIQTERTNHVNGLILRASEKRDQVTAYLGHRDVSPDVLDAQLAELRSDLHTLKSILEDDKQEDKRENDPSLRLMAAAHRVVRHLFETGRL